jgi:hypothetical protein
MGSIPEQQAIYKECLRVGLQRGNSPDIETLVAFSVLQMNFDVSSDPFRLTIFQEYEFSSILEDLRNMHKDWTLQTYDRGS